MRLAVLVLAARTPSASGVVEIRTRELARWLGMSESYAASVVVPGLRRSGVVEVVTATGEFGENSGLRCRVLPLWEARSEVGHPLALHRKELATLFRLMEALMAPGWVHRDGSVTPPGLIGTRTGRGAATDRLALLLLVLETAPTGRVRQCGGTIDTKRGRAAATVARLLGCTAAAAERVLERLEHQGLIERVRLRTASGMVHRTRLMVPAVAAAHGNGPSPQVTTACLSDVADPDAAAGSSDAPHARTDTQVRATDSSERAATSEPDVPAGLHSDHSAGVPGREVDAGSEGFSGEVRRGRGRRPGRACAREAEAEPLPAGPKLQLGTSAASPLRGDKPQNLRVHQGRREDARPRPESGRNGPSQDDRLLVALGPVACLWSQFTAAQRRLISCAAETELITLSGITGPEVAPQLLAQRLTERLRADGGPAGVREPVGWLLRRGLVQRPACSDMRCDDGTRLDTGSDCPTCDNVIRIRRAQRARTVAEVEASMPSAAAAARRAALEERLRNQVVLEAETLVQRRRQAEARQEAVRAKAQAEAANERAAAKAARAARQAIPCEDCGADRAAGLCETCGYRRQTRDLIAELGLIAATWAADLDDPVDIEAVAASVRANVQRRIDERRQHLVDLMDPTDHEYQSLRNVHSVLAFNALQTVRDAEPEYRASALAMLARSVEADAEALRAYATEESRRWHQQYPDTSRAAAQTAAHAARQRTAQHLLDTRLDTLRAPRRPKTGTVTASQGAPRGPWSDRLAELATRPIKGEELSECTGHLLASQ
ncbi:hypothetical protein ACFU5O_27950 [Streptomyces sp. NPDC057445]|uniref:hypothetical protein n=1 Tax=Streptomyces sp. NPDC057445 TaxID=3346136 RepID=UPI0036828485